jgi:hypothetical protein
MITNASTSLSSLVETLSTARAGFTGLIVRKAGVVRGGQANPVTYGDDLVHAVIVSGFRYGSLVERSVVALDAMTDSDMDAIVARGYQGWVRVWTKSMSLPELVSACQAEGVDATGKKADLISRLEAAVPGGQRQVAITRADLDAARVSLRADLQSTVDGTNESTTDHVFEPLVRDGQTVRGARVYVGNPDPLQNASEPGTIYLQGLVIGERVLEVAANGPAPETKSAPETVAKASLRRRLPVSRYVSYRLTPGGDWILSAGAAAATAADQNGVTTDPARVAAIRDLLVA